MSEARLEAFIEPFRENDPGPHVLAAVEAIEAAGLTADLGALATTAEGDVDQVIAASAALLRAALAEGATTVQLRIERT